MISYFPATLCVFVLRDKRGGSSCMDEIGPNSTNKKGKEEVKVKSREGD